MHSDKHKSQRWRWEKVATAVSSSGAVLCWAPICQGDPKTYHWWFTSQNSVICRTDPLGPQKSAHSCSHFLGSGLYSLFYSQPHLYLCPKNQPYSRWCCLQRESSFHCHSCLPHLLFLTVPDTASTHMPSAESSQRPPNVGLIGIVPIPSLAGWRRNQGAVPCTQAPGHIANKWQNQNLNSAQADITDYTWRMADMSQAIKIWT